MLLFISSKSYLAIRFENNFKSVYLPRNNYECSS